MNTDTIILPSPESGAKALVVDDDPVMRLMLRETLERAGHEVEEAADGEEAIETFKRFVPDIVLMDVEMPRMDGIKACRALRTLPEGWLIPILMVTGIEDTESINRAYRAGATDFVSKPISWPILGQRVRYLLRSAYTLRELEISESKIRVLVDAVPDSMCVLDADGVVHQMLGRGEDSGRWPPESAKGRPVAEFLKPGQADELLECVRAALADDDIRTIEFTETTTGERRYREARISQYREGRVLALVRDVTERVNAAHKVHRLAYYDTLTGLPNRQRFLRELREAIAQADRDGSSLALLFIDLDAFKRINDNMGHSTGDAVLEAAAHRLQECIRGPQALAGREGDGPLPYLARLGGDEFVILAPGIRDQRDAEQIAMRVQATLPNPFHHLGREFVVTPSIGIALYPRDGSDPESLLKNADSAMYQAKAAGRNTHRSFSETMSARSMERLDLEMRFRRAVENGDLTLYYQPKLDLKTLAVSGVESLLRWKCREQGYVSPQVFVPLAEELGLIAPLSQWVLTESCRQIESWSRDGITGLTVAVNVSSQHFSFGNVVADVSRALGASGIYGRSLELELTESLFLRDIEQTRRAIEQLRELGASLAVDDFGTGYSSLSYLKRLQVDALKIDRSFVRDVTTDADDRAICGAIVAMGRTLGLKIIAEGIETEEQLRIIRELGCDEVQGFLFSRAVPADCIPQIVRESGVADEDPPATEVRALDQARS